MFKAIIIASLIFLFGCTPTSSTVVMLDDSVIYPVSAKTEILFEPPDRKYKQIAMIETKGGGNTDLPTILEGMRSEAMKVGADAVMPTEDASRTTPKSVIYNPWLGGYQTLGGINIPKLRGIAIKYTD
ncbi:hypothetical protein A3193_18495 [Candidatus Thiodiazotropha endoloripes]|uniref:hypothetical protein n=1 Tax=Candidatus Thiodiazotropha endoloripes TaxID=1818881 RepID=UPI00083E6CD6|nr:hypothetical protein [Candidatus Thiodiazotropha endoloripes]ODB82739.1 hypothetical protein A3193_18495 [Candidatus Thiodiazotropha endoloripes]